MRVGMIHQPHFLPWPGYVARCLAADVFVVLDNVNFKANHFQQRTRFVDVRGTVQWLTLPIAGTSRGGAISQVRLAEGFLFKRWQRRFVQSYSGRNDFDCLWGDLSPAIARQGATLLEITAPTLEILLNAAASWVGGTPPSWVLASTIPASSERTARLVDICTAERITHLIMGHDAIRSHRIEVLRAAGIDLVSHEYRGSPAHAPLPGVTILHDVAIHGSSHVADWLTAGWTIDELRV